MGITTQIGGTLPTYLSAAVYVTAKVNVATIRTNFDKLYKNIGHGELIMTVGN